ncbi:hypothetical protein ACWDRB_44420 [Nonomuraea sp. NPDC003707]
MGDTREAYRFLAPLLVEAGYRVAARSAAIADAVDPDARIRRSRLLG